MTFEDRIIYLDNHLLVLDKPGGIPTQPAPDGPPGASLEEQAKDYLKQKFDKPGNVFLQAVHRIDKAVGGVVIFGRTSKAVARLSEQLRNGTIDKTYTALVEGKATGKDILLEDWLVHAERRARIGSPTTKNAKLSRLSYSAMKSNGKFSLVSINLGTGRYHQIRIQLAHAGLHIVGDTKYGAKNLWKQPGAIALQCTSMCIDHPVTAQRLIFNAKTKLDLP